jgi:translation initiation factor 1 (eIF-1/SUI1)
MDVHEFLAEKEQKEAEVKKIFFKYLKKKKAHVTYIYNLELYVKDIEATIKKLKSALGTSGFEDETAFGKAYGFNGDMKVRIIKYLLDNKLVVDGESAFESK